MPDRHLDLHACAINTATLGHRSPIEVVIDAVARHGFGGIAPWRRDLEGRSPVATARRIRDAGLVVSCYCRSTYLPASSPAQFARNVDDNRAAIEQAAVLGARAFVMVVGGLPEGSRDLAGARAQVLEGCTALHEHARALGVRLALEPLHPMYAADRSCLSTLEQALDACEAIEPGEASPLVGVCVDAYHCWWDPRLLDQIARAGRGGRILGFHVSDWLVPTRDLLMDRGMMGDGVIDLTGLRGAVDAAGFDGLVEVEIFSAADWWTRPEEKVLATCAERLRQCC
jgi:sugar phosphate isomerase/epimerase